MKVVYVCCERLLELAGKSKALSRSHESSRSTINSSIVNLDHRGSGLKTSFSKLSVRSDIDLKEPDAQPLQCSKSFEDLPNARLKGMLLQPEEQDTSSGVGSTDLTLDGDDINGGVCLDDNYDNLSDDDGIAFGASAAEKVDNEKKKDKSDSAPEEGKCGGSSDQNKSRQSEGESSQSPSDTQLSKQVADSGRQSSPSTSDQNPTDSIVSNGNDPDRKRKLKKKGLVERLKGRSKRTEEGKGTEVTENKEGTSNWDGQSTASEGKSDVCSTGRTSLLSPGVDTAAELKICKAMAAMEYSDEARQKADNIEVCICFC